MIFCMNENSNGYGLIYNYNSCRIYPVISVWFPYNYTSYQQIYCKSNCMTISYNTRRIQLEYVTVYYCTLIYDFTLICNKKMHFQTQSDNIFCCQIENEKTVIFHFVIFWILNYFSVSFLPNITTLIHYFFDNVRFTPSLIYIYSSYLIIHFADWLSVMYIIFSSNGFAAHLTLAAFRMIMFLRQFYRITLDFLFADTALVLKFLHSVKLK